MFKKDPTKKLRKAIEAKMKDAMQAQRSGDIPKFAALTAEAEALEKELEAAIDSGK